MKIRFDRFEIVWFIVATFILLGVSIAQKDTLLGIIVAVSGMLNVLLIAKRSMWNYLFGIINTALYAYVAFTSGYGGDFVTFTFYYLPLQFVGILSWKRQLKVEGDESIVEVNSSFSLEKWILLIVNLLLGTLVTMWLLPLITSIFGMPINQLPLVDAFTTYAGITAGVLMAKRYKEQWYIWILVNMGSVLMWVILIGKEEVAVSMAIMWLAYLINAIYGLYKWSCN